MADACTYLDDTLAIAALYRCLARALWRQPELNAEMTPVGSLIADENKWRAQRYGIEGGLVDERERRLMPFAEALENLLTLVAEDAAHFGCETELNGIRRILERGTSAKRQLTIYSDARARGARRIGAIREVVDWLIETTAAA